MTICRYTAKVIQPSRGAAEAQLRSLKKIKPAYNGHVFPCIHCQGFHIGRKRQDAHKNKYSARWDGSSTDKTHNVIEIE